MAVRRDAPPPAELQPLLERLAVPGVRLTLLTGAGVSAGSGVPTFRGDGGLWRSQRASELATPAAFAADPRLVWEWYDWRRQAVAACQPNRAHQVIATWSRRHEGFTLITQNVDGLHERAGTHNVVRFHGSLWEVGCADACPGSPRRWIDETVPYPELPPACAHCGGLLRPGVVWFGESIDEGVLAESQRAAVCDVFMVVGTSGVVHPAAGLVELARSSGAYTVEVNLEPTALSPLVDLVLAGPAEQVLERLEAELVAPDAGGG